MSASPALDPPRESAGSHTSETVAVVIPTLNEAESIGAVIAALPRRVVDRIIVADGGSSDGTPAIARGAGAEVVAVDFRIWARLPCRQRGCQHCRHLGLHGR